MTLDRPLRARAERVPDARPSILFPAGAAGFKHREKKSCVPRTILYCLAML